MKNSIQNFYVKQQWYWLQNIPILLLFLGFIFSSAVANSQEIDQQIRTTIEKLIAESPKEDSVIIIDDMVFLKSQLSGRSSFTGTRWPRGNVYYTFNSNVTDANKQKFLSAAKKWEDCASVKFILRTTEPNYIELKDATVNNSNVGMIGGSQIINIYNWSYPYIIAHEIAHALGEIHEHSRSDRDTYVTILTDNIIPGKEGNFNIMSSSDNYGEYDFESVMHYKKNDFSIDKPNLNTIEPNTGYEGFLESMGQRTKLSILDKKGMALRYPSMIDVALVLDRSGSMNSYGYMSAAKTAAQSFVGLMQLNDWLAVTSFSSYASTNFSFAQLTSEAIRTNAINSINSINAGGTTSIGAGLQSAQSQLNNGNTATTQGMILLSDGYENSYPYVSNILPTIPGNTDIYTIALGPNSDQNLLNSIASATGGFYSYAPNTQRLTLIYNSIRAKVTGQQTLALWFGLIAQGQNFFQTVFIDGGMSLANFSLTWPGSDLDLELTDPDGNVIDHGTTDPNVVFSSGGTFENYAVSNPTPGEWTLKIIGVSTSGQEPYTATVSGESILTMDIALDKSAYGSNEPIVINAQLIDGTTPVTGATVTVDITNPATPIYAPLESESDEEPTEGIELFYDEINETQGQYIDDSEEVYYTYGVATMELYDDGAHNDGAANDGVYGNSYTSTNYTGSYTFDVSATGTAPTSGEFSRIDSKSTTVTSSQGIAVTEPQTGVEWTVGQYHTIDWSSTNITGNVDIYLSTDGGTIFDIPLAMNTADDGTEDIMVPNRLSTTCRIKVVSVDHTGVSGTNPGNFSIIEPLPGGVMTVYLVDSNSDPLAGGMLEYRDGGWQTAIETSDGVFDVDTDEDEIELRMTYMESPLYVTVPATSDYTFQTVLTTLELRKRTGALGYNYGRVCFAGYGPNPLAITGDDGLGIAYVELLPRAYTFRMKFRGGMGEITQDISIDPVVTWQMARMLVQINKSDGTRGLNGADIKYKGSSMEHFGITGTHENGRARKDMLPGFYKFTIKYLGGKQVVEDFEVVPGDNELIIDGIATTVELMDINGDPVDGGKARNIGVSGNDMGFTGDSGPGTVTVDLLPITYNFEMTYDGDSDTQESIDVNVTPWISFSTDDLKSGLFLDNDNIGICIYPNPYTTTTTFGLSSAKPQTISISIYDITGKEVISLFDGPIPEGNTKLVWDGSNYHTGMYIIKITSENEVKSKLVIKH